MLTQVTRYLRLLHVAAQTTGSVSLVLACHKLCHAAIERNML
jgi:hypothetical protein